MFKSIFVKNVALDSSAKNSEVKAEFFDDKEWKIIVNCGKNTNPPSLAEGARGWVVSNESQIAITFFALENDIDSLVKGYLATFLDSCVNLANLMRENNNFFVDSPLSKDEILSRLSQKDIIQSCEQISLNDKKINRDSIIMPFNGSRAHISRKILEANRDFFADSNESTHKARIVRCESTKSRKSIKSIESCAESFDTNPKNVIYKAIGKTLDLRDSKGNLLDATIFLNFRLEIETLKILILQKCTFIVCAEKPAFSVVRFAQKFGITLIAFIESDSRNADLAQRADLQNSFLVLTHQMRFLDNDF